MTIISSDPKTQAIGDLILNEAVKLNMTNGDLAAALTWLQLWLFINAQGGDIAEGCEAMESVVLASIASIKGARHV
jgi:hypothetical protein